MKLSEINAVSQIREHWMEKYLHSFPLREVVRVRSHTRECEVYSVQNGTGMSFSSSTSVLPCQYHSTNTPYSSSPACYSH